MPRIVLPAWSLVTRKVSRCGMGKRRAVRRARSTPRGPFGTCVFLRLFGQWKKREITCKQRAVSRDLQGSGPFQRLQRHPAIECAGPRVLIAFDDDVRACNVAACD